MKMKFAAAALAAISMLAAQERFDLKVRNYFFAGFAGDKESLETGMKMCEEALATDAKNAEALVWHGSGLVFESGAFFQKGDQKSGMELWTRGMGEMDEAVTLAPDKVGVRIPRGAALMATSRFVPPDTAKPLLVKAVDDYEHTYEMQSSYFDKLGKHPRGELMIGMADGYSRLGDQEKAATWFKRIQTDLKGTPYEKSADLWLETKSLPAAKAGCLGCHTGK
jgi:hypothetical protein